MRTAIVLGAMLLFMGAGCGRAESITPTAPAPTPPETSAPAIPPNAPPPTSPPPTAVVPPTAPPGIPTPAPAAARVIKITAKDWQWSPSEIRTKKGERVIFEVTSADIDHGFAIPELGINRALKPGVTERIPFTADKMGTFSFLCSVSCGQGTGGHGHRTMRGALIVE